MISMHHGLSSLDRTSGGTDSIPLLLREDLKTDFKKILELKGPKYPPQDQLLTYSPTVDDLNKRSLLKLASTPFSDERVGISHQ